MGGETGDKDSTAGRRRRSHREQNIVYDGGKEEKMEGAIATCEVVEVREFHP